MRRLLLSGSLIAAACVASSQQPEGEIPATTRSEEARQHYERGRTFGENARTAEALEAFDSSLEVDPGFVSARALLGFHTPGEPGLQQLEQANQESEGLPEAERTFIRLLRARRREDTNGAIAEARRLVALVPASARAHVALGQVLVSAQDYVGAATEAQRAIDLDPRFGPALNMLGYAMLQRGKMPEAIEAFRRYAAAMPDEPNALDSLGDALLAAGRYADAEAAFHKSVEISPRFWNGFEGIACAKFYQGDFSGARGAFESGRKVADRSADRATLEQVAAFEALAEDKPADAMRILEEIERIPDLPPDRLLVLPIARAIVHLHRGMTHDALAELDKMTALSAGGGLPPPVERILRRYTLTVRSAIEATKKDLGALRGTVAMIRQDAVAHPEDKEARSALHFATGMEALARGDRDGALDEWSHCLIDDTLCQGYLAIITRERSDEILRSAAPITPVMPAGRGYVNARDPIFLYLSTRRSMPGSSEH